MKMLRIKFQEKQKQLLSQGTSTSFLKTLTERRYTQNLVQLFTSKKWAQLEDLSEGTKDK